MAAVGVTTCLAGCVAADTSKVATTRLGPARVCYSEPVAAPVIDPFRPPSARWGPGNRGITYRTAPGTAVVAAAPGIVTFAGAVAHQRYVSMVHPDGLRTTYSYLATVDVWIGELVAVHQRVGTSGSVFQFGVRSGTTYLDPLSIIGQGCGRTHAVLVPIDRPQ